MSSLIREITTVSGVLALIGVVWFSWHSYGGATATHSVATNAPVVTQHISKADMQTLETGLSTFVGCWGNYFPMADPSTPASVDEVGMTQWQTRQCDNATLWPDTFAATSDSPLYKVVGRVNAMWRIVEPDGSALAMGAAITPTITQRSRYVAAQFTQMLAESAALQRQHALG